MQNARFQILEELGCTNSLITAGLEVLLMDSTPILFPLASLILYSREYEHDSGYLSLTSLSEFDIYVSKA